MEFAKLSAPSLKDLFVQQLQGMILSDELPMGTQLPPERELAQQMQVSRAVVNGGLAELAQQGFLEVRPRQGTFVADYRRKGNLSTLIAIMEYQGGVLGKDEIRSILEVRRALEHLAAQRAIRYASDEALARLGDIVARIAAAQNTSESMSASITPILNSSRRRSMVRVRVVVLPEPGELIRLSRKILFSFSSRRKSSARWSLLANTLCLISKILTSSTGISPLFA